MSPDAIAHDRDGAVEAARSQGERLAERLPGLLVEAERVAMTVTQGVHGRRRAGVGETFWQFRYFQQGDAVTAIDWRQSARSHRLFVREQEWEAAQSVWIWCDLSRSMRFASDRSHPSKLERALVLALACAVMLVRGGERIAVLGSGKRPRGGRHALDAFMESLIVTAQRAEPLPPAAELPRHSRLVAISDFLEPVESLVSSMQIHAERGIEASLLQVLDPAEELLPYRGRVLFEGLEAEGNALVRNVGKVRERYLNRLAAHQAELNRLCGRLGWRMTMHRTDRPAEPAVLALYQMLAPRTPA